MTTDDRRALIKAALSPDASMQAPADLGDAIHRAIVATPQRSAFGLGAWSRSPVALRSLLLLGLLALIAVATLAILARPAPKPTLSTYHGGPARTGISPGPAPSGVPIAVWQAERPDAIQYATMPLVAEGLVVVADASGSLAALDEASGDLVWQHQLRGGVQGTPVIVGGLVVVGTDAGLLGAVSLATGTLAWEHALGSPITASLVADAGVVYVPDGGGTISAWEVATGRSLWSYAMDAPTTRAPALADGVLYIGATGGRFDAIDIANCSLVWRTELGPGMVGTPTVGDGRIYVGRGLGEEDSTNDLVALDGRDGQQLWSFSSPTGQQVHAGALANGVAYGTSEDGNVYALDAATGRRIWTATTDGSAGTAAAVVGDQLFLSSADRTVRAVRAADGSLAWVVPVGGTPTAPSVINGRVIVGTNLGAVVAIGDEP